jgi:hypothetical protein
LFLGVGEEFTAGVVSEDENTMTVAHAVAFMDQFLSQRVFLVIAI